MNKNCRSRRSLPKMLAFYVKEPKCLACGRNTLTLDKHRMKKEVGPEANNCFCDGYHFPHRKGSKWCRDSTSPPTEEDYQDRYRSVPAHL